MIARCANAHCASKFVVEEEYQPYQGFCWDCRQKIIEGAKAKMRNNAIWLCMRTPEEKAQDAIYERHQAGDCDGDCAYCEDDRDRGTVTVCSACLQASCWQGIFYCDEYQTAGTVEKTITELRELNLEHSDYWKK